MQNKKNIIFIAIAVVLIGISFFAGTKFSSPKNKTNGPGDFSQFGQNKMGQGKGMQNSGGNIFGQIIARDATSITVELKSPANKGDSSTYGTGSKIVFYTDKTPVSKMTTGTMDDLVIGKEVNIEGTTNTDGSIIAKSISIRPIVSTTQTKN
jgi:hypothetical protein